jgi:tripartite-type tricarboxylate transporter receptor subunit TctC
MLGRADRPRPRPPRLADEVNKVQASPEIAALMKKLNFEPPPVKSSAQLGAIVQNDLQVRTKIANDAGIKIDE